MKDEIIRKAVILLGSNSSINSINSNSGSKYSRAEALCEEFVNSAIEDVVLSIKWPFALKRIDNIEGKIAEFTEVIDISDCIKVAVIVPSNLQFYTEAGRIYFKGGNLTSLFYYARKNIDRLLGNEKELIMQVPAGFKLLAALSLASQVAFAMYSDSLFAEGLKKQYLIKLEETRRIYRMDYNLINSGEV